MDRGRTRYRRLCGLKPRQAKGVSSYSDSSTNQERPAIDEQEVATDPADSYLFSCPEDGCIKSYMTHGRLEQHLMYGRHNFRQNKSLPLLDRAKISYADRLEEVEGTIINYNDRLDRSGYNICFRRMGWSGLKKKHAAGSARNKNILREQI